LIRISLADTTTTLYDIPVTLLYSTDNKYFAHRLFRDSCLAVEGNFLKDLTVLNRDLRHTVLVDNSPHAFGYHLENGIPIESWYEDPMDRELLKLEKFLVKDLHDATGALVPDVRSVCACKFQCRELVDRAPAYGQAQAK
jgi:CTD small phosphatase-like protein 2